MEDETDGWGDFEEIDFAEADDPPSELKDETPEAEDVTKPKDAEKSATSKPSGWGSLMNFGQALLAEASHALTTEPEPDSPDDKLQTDLAALLQHYHHVLEDIYRQHNPERVSDIQKLIDRYREQAEKVEDFGAFKAHCEEKLESFHQAVCKKYGVEVAAPTPAHPSPDEPIRAASAPPIRAAIVAIYETHNPAKLSHVDELLQKFKGKESTLYKSICEKYGVEPDPAWLEDEPKAEPTTSLGGLFGGAFNAARSLGGATALQSLQTAAEGLHTLREKVERSFDEALADRGDALAEPGEASGGTKDGEEEAGPPDTEATVQEKKDSSGEVHAEQNTEAQERLEQERLEQEQQEAERQEQERLPTEKEEAERLQREREEQERLEQERLEQERMLKEKEEAERLQREREEQERLEQERLEQERLEQEQQEAERQEQERMLKEKEEAERLQREREEQERLEQERLEQERLLKETEEAEEEPNPFEATSNTEDSPSTQQQEGEGSEASPSQSPAAEGNKALELLAEYEVRVKEVYQKHNPDALSDPHLDQILSKYREQILSRPQDANNPQVLERYRERLESLYKAISARYVDEGKDLKAMYIEQITAIYREHNPTKLAEVDKLFEKYAEQLPVLYQSICQKYDVKPLPELVENDSTVAHRAPAEESKSLWGASFLTSGLQTLKTLHGAAEGIREHMEKSFEEAIRSEEDISAMQMVQGLGQAAEKGAQKAEMKSAKEVVSTALPTSSGDPESAVEGASNEKSTTAAKVVISSENMQEFEALQLEKEKLTKENRNLKAEKDNLIMEGTKMSRRVQSVEERMKAMSSELRRAEQQTAEAERRNETLSGQLARMTSRAEKAEAQCGELKGEARKTLAELERAKQQLQGEKRQMQADHQALQMKTRESTEKERRMEERIQHLCHERDELRATSSSLTVELQQALGAVDHLERRLQQQAQEAEQLQEQHRRQLEAAECEFVNESMPYQQRLGELEAQLAHQEQKFLEREAVAYRERDKERAELEAAKEELQRREAMQERRARELRDEVERAKAAQCELQELRKEMAEVDSAREAADRSREAAEGELKLESARRRSLEQRQQDLQQQVEKLQSSTTGGVKESELQLRMQVSAVTQQRDNLQQEVLKLQKRVEAQRAGDAQTQMAQRFELALQAIGKLQEELEACQAQRDAFQKKCQQLAGQGAGA